MASGSAQRAARVALAAILASALLHAWLHASIRPLYQVSDEVSYLSALQHEIYGTDRADAAAYQCASPPVGIPLFIDPGGKHGFRHSGAWLLRRLCEAGVPSQTAFWMLRLWSGLSLPLVVLCTASLARTIGPTSLPWTLGAAFVVALQPILATFAGGITPDAYANALSAVTLLLATRQVSGRGGWGTAATMLATAIAAATWKDTTLFLLPTVALALVWNGLARATARRSLAGWVLAGSMVAAVLLVTMPSLVWRLVQPTMALDARFGAAMFAGPLALAGVTLSTLGHQIPQLGWGVWMPLGNFGATTLTMPGAFGWLGMASLAAVGSGVARLLVDESADAATRRIAVLWLAAIVLCALQPALRQAVDGRPELLQGRWLFPVMAPCAVLATWWLRHGGRRWLPLTMVAAASVAIVAVVRVVGHYYLDFPSTYDWPHLFLRSSSNIPLDEVTMRLWVRRPLPLQQGAWLAAGFVLWATTTLVAAVAAMRLSDTQERYDRHTHHR